MSNLSQLCSLVNLEMRAIISKVILLGELMLANINVTKSNVTANVVLANSNAFALLS